MSLLVLCLFYLPCLFLSYLILLSFFFAPGCLVPRLVQCDRDKLGVRYRGQANHEKDWGTVRANHPLPRRRRVWYFEVTIAAMGDLCNITIGLVPDSFPMHKQPGAEVCFSANKILLLFIVGRCTEVCVHIRSTWENIVPEGGFLWVLLAH